MAQYIKTEDGYKKFAAVTYDKMDKTDPTGTGSFSMNRKAGTVIGTNSHAEGNDTTASDYYSHAEGSETVASGYISHAEGHQTTASGTNSHAEGDRTTASGSYSHAEGYLTTAKDSNSHAEGIETTAIGFSSHAEGGSTNAFSSVVTTTNPTTGDIINVWKSKKFSVAKGDYSHVEGKDNLALNSFSHAEGYLTTASGNYSHAEGNDTTASGFNSHAEGSNTKATSTNDSTSITFSPNKGYYTHAEGFGTVAYGRCSHAEGNGTKASGNDSHSEGYGTVAYGTCSHAEGDGTKASGTSSHAEGYKTTASGNYSHAEGYSTNMFSSVVTTNRPTTDDIINVWKNKKFSVAKGHYSHVEGWDNLALDDYSHAEGYQTTASGEDSHAEGTNTKASGDHSHTEGANTTASGLCSHAEGNITTASGTGSHVEGGSTKASGDYSHAEGIGTEASGSYSHAEGRRTKASGDNSHAQGKFNIEDTSSIYADIIGNGTSDTARSNAATVDWNGNAWFAGDVYTGSTSGTNKDEGSKKLATEEYVNNSIAAGGTDISLGLTSASVGQTIKVKAVNEQGMPTAWEAADMPSGGGETWELINAIEIADGTEETNALTISADKNGNAFSLKKARLITYFPKYTGESSIPGYSFTMINGFVSGSQAPLCYTSGLPSPDKSKNPEGWLEVDLSMPGYEVERVARFAGSGGRPAENMFWGTRRLNGAETITSIGGTNMLIYPGCKFILYGVRA